MSTITSTVPSAIPGASTWTPAPLYRMTVEEYEAMVASGAFKGHNRFHLINGYLVKKMTQNPPHTIADMRCGAELDRIIPPGWHVRPSKPIRLPAQATMNEPDRCVVRGAILDYEVDPGPAEIALIVEVSDSSLAEDRKLVAEVYGPAGIPICWVVDVKGRRVEVYTRPGPQGYESTEIFAEGQSVPVVIDGQERGRIAVEDILPPRRPDVKAEDNGA